MRRPVMSTPAAKVEVAEAPETVRTFPTLRSPVVVAFVVVAFPAVRFPTVVEPVEKRFETVARPVEVMFPTLEMAVAKRFVEEAVVEKKLVVVALVPVALVKVRVVKAVVPFTEREAPICAWELVWSTPEVVVETPTPTPPVV